MTQAFGPPFPADHVGRLALTPQCGFASSIGGNPLSESDEAAKLSLIVDVAKEVWADA